MKQRDVPQGLRYRTKQLRRANSALPIIKENEAHIVQQSWLVVPYYTGSITGLSKGLI